eukprot:TRINITY_DN5870_c0_g1_i1.p1 TRINITY_DN5870_c0_g1~~TRINITY_DN5870_c0_g1_i1.p1  ORF type:complete len:348 (+),score=115.81 TRINITY_DN5870_c0_g1_i1:72-1115(+)
MRGLSALFLAALLGQALAGFERDGGRARKKCDWIQKEMSMGRKQWMMKQSWFHKLAHVCGIATLQQPAMSVTDAVPAMPAMPAMIAQEAHAGFPMMNDPSQLESMLKGSGLGEGPQALKGALGEAMGSLAQVMQSQDGQDLKIKAMQLAREAANKAATGGMHNKAERQELKMKAMDMMRHAKTAWDKNVDPEQTAHMMQQVEQAKEELTHHLPEEAKLQQAMQVLQDPAMKAKLLQEMQHAQQTMQDPAMKAKLLQEMQHAPQIMQDPDMKARLEQDMQTAQYMNPQQFQAEAMKLAQLAQSHMASHSSSGVEPDVMSSMRPAAFSNAGTAGGEWPRFPETQRSIHV